MSKQEIKSLRSESPVGRIFDLPERLSPMMVKELRQGLRSIGFTGLFIGMQALLGFIILLMLLAGADSEPSSVSYAIFSIYIITVCGLQPLRGLHAIAAETSGDTIDLVMITRLSSWKIVFGKWVSLVGQSFIFSISLLPYLILRYFLGDMMLFNELFFFASVFLIGCISTAIAVGASAITTAILRLIISGSLIIGLLILTFSSVNAAIAAAGLSDIFFGMSPTIATYMYIGLTLCILGGYTSWMFLDFGASMIAPISENRSTLRRLMYLLFLTIGVSTCFILRASMINYAPFVLVIQIILITAFIPFFIFTFGEQGSLSPRIMISIKKRPLISKFRYLLYPGWATGLIFLTLCIGTLLAMPLLTVTPPSSLNTMDFDKEAKDILYTIITCCIATLTFPAALLTVFARNVTNRLGIYLILLIASFVITFVLAILSTGLSKDIHMVFIWIPTVSLFELSTTGLPATKTWIGLLNTALILIHLLIIFLRSKETWRHIRQQELYVKNLTNTQSVEQI